MSYDPSHRKPPRQARWPQATPPEGWPSYRDGGAYRDGNQADGQDGTDRQGAYRATASYQRQAGYQRASGGSPDRGYQSAVATDAFAPAGNGYGGAGNGYGSSGNGYGSSGNGYGRATDEYAGDANGYDWNGHGSTTDGFATAQDDFAGSAAYLGPGSYTELTPSGPMLVAPDAGVYPDSWQADQDRRREGTSRCSTSARTAGPCCCSACTSSSPSSPWRSGC